MMHWDGLVRHCVACGAKVELTWKAFMWEVGAWNQRSSPAVFVRRRRNVAFRFSSCSKQRDRCMPVGHLTDKTKQFQIKTRADLPYGVVKGAKRYNSMCYCDMDRLHQHSAQICRGKKGAPRWTGSQA